jgi:hypothetical protein
MIRLYDKLYFLAEALAVSDMNKLSETEEVVDYEHL